MYPSWRYHAEQPPRVIQGPHEEEAGWSDSPAAHGRAAFVAQGMTGSPMQLTSAPQATTANSATPRAAAKRAPKTAGKK